MLRCPYSKFDYLLVRQVPWLVSIFHGASCINISALIFQWNICWSMELRNLWHRSKELFSMLSSLDQTHSTTRVWCNSLHLILHCWSNNRRLSGKISSAESFIFVEPSNFWIFTTWFRMTASPPPAKTSRTVQNRPGILDAGARNLSTFTRPRCKPHGCDVSPGNRTALFIIKYWCVHASKADKTYSSVPATCYYHICSIAYSCLLLLLSQFLKELFKTIFGFEVKFLDSH